MKENIFSKIPKDIPEELFEKIVESKDVKIERIISRGHTTKEGKWYNQDKNEFVIVLKGYAVIEYKDIVKDKSLSLDSQRQTGERLMSVDYGKKIKMNVGDYLIIPAHVKHKVVKTSDKEETIWLAVFY